MVAAGPDDCQCQRYRVCGAGEPEFTGGGIDCGGEAEKVIRNQNSAETRRPKLRGGAKAVPEKRPAKSMTFRRPVRFMTSAWKWIPVFSRFIRSTPIDASSEKSGRTRPR